MILIVLFAVVVILGTLLFFKIKKNYAQEIAKKQIENDEIIKNIRDNFNETIPYGERFIIRSILKLLRDADFNDYTFYHQVEYLDNEQFYQLDFLVVTPFGVVVLESKYWKGVTYLYNNAYSDIFQNTFFEDFGLGSSEKIKVFNAKFLEDNKKKIVFSSYQNPVSQVRGYSFNIKKQLELPVVKNVVVFHKSEFSNILFNDKKLNIKAIDSYTKIITSESIKEYFIEEANGKNRVPCKKIISSIEKRLTYKTKFDKNNYRDKIFSYLLDD